MGEIASKASTYFIAPMRMYFPFLTCEVKCGATALNVANRQTAHSMTVAVKGVVVEIYRAVKREEGLNRKSSPFRFRITICCSTVRMCRHYAIIVGDKISFTATLSITSTLRP